MTVTHQVGLDSEPIVFYLPFKMDRITHLPARVSDYWSWIIRNRGVGEGKYSWTLQTYLHLRSAGVPCELTERFPSRGLVVSHRDFLPIYLRPRPNVFLVCIKPDRKRHTWAQFYVVQNPLDTLLTGKTGTTRVAAIPSWPQPSLVPRNPARGSRCESVAYFGRAFNLAEELKSDEWKSGLRSLGFEWSKVGFENWHDYSAIDVTVSVRSFEERPADIDPVRNANCKPPAKLTNSWLAGVPAIVGAESAYQSVRRNSLDFIEVKTSQEIKDALLELKHNSRLYRDMVDHGLTRGQEFSSDAVCGRWMELVGGEIATAYEAWQAKGSVRSSLENARNVIEYFSDVQNIKDIRTIFRWT